MSVDISIKEGNSSKQFYNVEEIEVNGVSGGSIPFVPKDEADKYAHVSGITITKNGIYDAKTAGLVGYNTVNVKVPSSGAAGDENMLIEKLFTSISNFALIPKIQSVPNGYEWIGGKTEGEPNRTFRANGTAKYREYFDISGKNAKILFDELVVPNDYSDINEDDVSLFTLEGTQLYFVSLTNFSAGFTTVSPRTYNTTITPYIEDMYKVRRLKSAADVQTLLNIYSSTSTVTVNNDTVFNKNIGIEFNDFGSIGFSETIADRQFNIDFGNTGSKTGFLFKQNKSTGETDKIYRADGVEYQIPIFKIYNSYKEAEEDVENTPENTIGILRSR